MSHMRNLKRKRFNQPEEVVFDFSARQDYLTGFHKRKLERAKHAQDVAAKKEKEIRLETRRMLRAERKAELEKYVKSVDESIAKHDESWGSHDEDNDSDKSDTAPAVVHQPINQEEDYSDDDRHVTVHVEEVDITRQGFQPANVEEEEKEEDVPKQHDKASGEKSQGEQNTKKRKWSAVPPKKDKKRKGKPRYETLAERKLTRAKQRRGGAKARAKRKG